MTDGPSAPTPRWRPSSFWQGVAIAAAVTLGALFFLGFVTLDGLRDREEAAERQADLSSRIVLTVTGLVSDIVDMETGQRGYLLTGDAAYLASYEAGQARLPGRIADLAALESRTVLDAQREGFAAMRAIAGDKVAELARTIALADAGQGAEALRVVREGSGLALMAELRGLAAAVVAREQTLQARARAAAREARDRVGLRLGALGVVMAGLIAVSGWLAFVAARDLTFQSSFERATRERDRADLLRRELSHRVKNLFAVVIAMVGATLRESDDPLRASALVRARLQALGRAHSISLGEAALDGRDGVPEHVSLAHLAREVAGAYAEEAPLAIEGDLAVPSRHVTPWGLILNELATNALKHGGLARGGGGVTLRIDPEAPGEGRRIVWRERAGSQGEPDGPGAGFGNRLLDGAVSQIAARLDRTWHDDGLEVVIAVPD